MIGIVFGGGAPDNVDQIFFIGGSQKGMYYIGMGLLAIVVVSIPIYLFVKPCCFRHKAKVGEAQEIEFSKIEQQEPLMNSIQNERNMSDISDNRGVKSID